MSKHYSSDYIENFFGKSKWQRQFGYKKFLKHLKTCQLCQTTLEDVKFFKAYASGTSLAKRMARKFFKSRWIRAVR